MIDSIYVAASGLGGHQKGLKVISNNVANLNTPGFKGSQAQFADVFLSEGGDAGHGGSGMPGGGLDTLAPTVNFRAGELRDTGRDLDMALDGPGFFVVRNNQGESLYTKSGRFEFNSDGRLVTMDNGFPVLGLSGASGLGVIDVGDLKLSKPKVTTAVTLDDNLSSTGSDATVNVTVYDRYGDAHALKVALAQNGVIDSSLPNSPARPGTPGTWKMVVTDNAVTVGEGQVAMLGGKPDPAADSVTVAIKAADGSVDNIEVVLGDKVSNNSGGSSSRIKVASVDGNTRGTITKTLFDETGTLVITYSNSLTAKGPQLAVAEFATPEVLTQTAGSLFEYTGTDPVRLLAAGTTTKIKEGSLELSNVDLTDQFSNMILIQRGFQASSQVLSTASEMIQALYDMKSRR